MKKFTGICLIVSAVILAAGIACCTAGAAMGFTWSDLKYSSRLGNSWIWRTVAYWNDVEGYEDYGYYDSTDWDNYDPDIDIGDFDADTGDIDINELETRGGEHMRVGMENVQELDVEIKNGTLRIEPSSDGTMYMEAWGYLKKLDYSQDDDGEFKIKDRSRAKDRYKKSVIIYVPDGLTFTKTKISLGAGAGYVENMTVSEKAEFELGAGELDVNQFTGGELKIQCGVGKLSLNGSVKGDVDVNCGIGDTFVRLANAENEFNYDMECGIGSIDLNGSSYTALGARKKINNDAIYEFELECGIGTIEIDMEQ
ncbi:DUF4097 family beta strand repeat-containing protein [Diplocloster agilis]|uniref:DUF4097 domain-containing protein n=1 Tax=Diplocloster agilis TaxID=2850323 RepID=A0A949JZ83_9FIRM|nr:MULTISPECIES: DUF4097 family beta strand repeat-containing protein [Lachnospiraceae]MBU9737945.1 DUF4097 domain-containing protein [Diplocloster agilis]MBU9745596.1 DUF4097 domain-containing protein [Diplocloster agilis]MCU6732711.1 DUF4097 domain-containing protein [Suonthocola fibrivorans]SCI57906.1 Uncharacterised protein [uncultured Clostridium sp.]